MTEIETILRAFEAVRDGPGDPGNPVQVRLMQVMDEAGPNGMTFPALAEALLGRKLTADEDNLAMLRIEDMAGEG